MTDYLRLLAGLESACAKAARLALEAKPNIKRELKPDGSIVTSADREAENLIRGEIRAMGSRAAIWGEEHGYEPPNEHGLWMIDPIDGTSNYAFGQPLWGVTAALFHEDKIQIGCICVPELGWTFTATLGGGAFLNGSRIKPLRTGELLPHELVGYGDVRMSGVPPHPGKPRHIGAFVVEASLFLNGGYRVLITNGVRLYDAAAGILMAREVGAEVRELDGTPFNETEWTQPKRCRKFGFFPPDSGWPFQSQ